MKQKPDHAAALAAVQRMRDPHGDARLVPTPAKIVDVLSLSTSNPQRNESPKRDPNAGRATAGPFKPARNITIKVHGARVALSRPHTYREIVAMQYARVARELFRPGHLSDDDCRLLRGGVVVR